MTFFPVPWYILIVLIVIAVLATSLGAIAGFSGSVFIVPSYSLILANYNIPFIIIVGCSAAGCFFNGLLSTIINIRRREIDWFLAVIFEIPTTIGVFLGAFLTTLIDVRITTSIFSTFALVLTISLFRRLYKNRESKKFINGVKVPADKKEKVKKEEKGGTSDKEDKPTEEKSSFASNKKETLSGECIPPATTKSTKPRETSLLAKIAAFGPRKKIFREGYSYTVNILMLVVVAFGIGTLAGMVGCGGGWIKAPVLISGFGVPPIIAVSTSMLMTTITVLISGITHLILGNFALWLWIIIASGSLAGAIIGTSLKKKVSPRALQIIMTVTLAVIAVLLLVQTWIGL